MAKKESSSRQTVALREQNTSTILSLFLKREYLSRHEITAQTGLAPSTVSSITSDLIDRRILHRVGNLGASGAGRKAELLSRNPAASVIAAVHFTPESVRLGLIDFGYSLIASKDLHYPNSFDESQTGSVIEELQQLISKSGYRHALSGVGLALPNDPFDNDAIVAAFSESFDVPVASINNVEAMATCEYYFQLSKTLQTFVFVYVGTGIGSGFVIDGELYRGVTGKASDFGHTYVTDEPVRCRCGRTGCLEAVASEYAIMRELSRRRDDVAGHSRGSLVSRLGQLVQQEDEAAVSLLSKAADYLGKGVFNLVTVLDPQAVVITGRMNSLNPYFSNLVERSYIAQMRNNVFPGVPLYFTPLREDAGVTGAAMFCFFALYCGGRSRAAVKSKHHSF